MRRMRGFRIALSLLVGCAATGAEASRVVVLEARGVAFKTGAALDDGKVLDLNAGQSVTIINQAGDTIKLRGPFHQRPLPGAKGGGSLTVALRALLVQNEVRTSDVGAVRAGTAVVLPEPWVVDVSHPGTRCIREGEPVTFWRDDAKGERELTLFPLSREWRLASKWPAGQDRIPAPRELPLPPRATYLADIGDGPNAIILVTIPASVDTPAMRAAWMFEKGCNLQAETLAQSVK